ncbi:MAG: acyl-CoA dehydrogenase family protein [Acidimicrobiales bacterium]|jgi:alkylation response protein AidB-like acyl-CoA dehydrogenase|nr:acyl-CoA dehydrogenase family protein [Actinomycetota bacterium]
MDFSFTPEQEAFRQVVKDFVKRETSKELDREIDATGRFPAELSAKMAEAGLFGVPFPELYGGSGGGVLEFVILCEELAYGSEAASAVFLLPVFFAGEMLLLNGSDDQKQRWIPEIVAGRLRGCFALTEPDAGSDAANVQTFAEEKDDHFVLNGSKIFISGADVADFMMVVTRTDRHPPKKYMGMSIFMVDRNLPGVTVNTIPKLGGRAISLCEIAFEDVRVPKEMLMGGYPAGLGQGWGHMWASLDIERVMVAILYVATAQKAFDEALAHAKTRVQFGQTIGRFQAVQHQLADMRIELDAARLLAYRAAWLKSQGLPCSLEGASAKVFATEMAVRVTTAAMQVFGGQGYTMENDVQRYVREALLGPVGMGTNHVQRTIIAKLMDLM